jgi:hypothetical protein
MRICIHGGFGLSDFASYSRFIRVMFASLPLSGGNRVKTARKRPIVEAKLLVWASFTEKLFLFARLCFIFRSQTH